MRHFNSVLLKIFINFLQLQQKLKLIKRLTKVVLRRINEKVKLYDLKMTFYSREL